MLELRYIETQYNTKVLRERMTFKTRVLGENSDHKV